MTAIFSHMIQPISTRQIVSKNALFSSHLFTLLNKFYLKNGLSN